MTFGEKLKNLRIGIGKTQKELSEDVGISKRTIINYEAGQTDVLRLIVTRFAGIWTV